MTSEGVLDLRQVLGEHPAVIDVVIFQSDQIQHGGPDVGMVGPRAGGTASRNGALPTVGASRVRTLARSETVDSFVGHARAHEAEPRGVDLGGVVTVVVGKAVVHRPAPATDLH